MPLNGLTKHDLIVVDFVSKMSDGIFRAKMPLTGSREWPLKGSTAIDR